MKIFIKKIVKQSYLLTYMLDGLLFPINIISACWFRIIRFIGPHRTPLSKWMFHKIGVFPVVDHYYEPFFQYKRLTDNYTKQRMLHQLDWNIDEQLKQLNEFNYIDELVAFPTQKKQNAHDKISFFHKNGSFSFADAEYLYSFIRQKKPKHIIEIGSGFSTIMISEAIKKNEEQDNSKCELLCIEPYEMPWLESAGINVLRKTVESTPLDLFDKLQDGDILFIDSSHIIKPDGDVLHEIFSILPKLSKGVYIHFHDIFTPFNYPKQWLEYDYRFWNEQYLLEAFLTNNKNYEVVAAINYLFHFHRSTLLKNLPVASKHTIGGGSLWIRKI